MTVSIISGRRFVWVAAVLMLTVLLPRGNGVCPAQALDPKTSHSWPMFGGSPGRNMVNTLERNIPADWCVDEGKRRNIKWIAEVGKGAVGSPVVAHGKVFVATNSAQPGNPGKDRKPVLMALRESDGRFLWQIAHDLPADWQGPFGAVSPSTPAVVDHKLYYVTPPGEVICADADKGMIQWRYDMVKQLQVHPHLGWCFPATLSSPLVIGDLVFLVTGNGLGGDEVWKIVSPKAPSFIALDKRTGKLVWQSNLPGENIIEGQWSSPTFADAGGLRQVIFAGGDGVIYSFAPETGKLLWKCDCLPARRKKGAKGIDNHFVGTPVVVGGKLYVGLGVAPVTRGKPADPWSYFLCLDITKKGDVSLKSYDARAAENKGSALVWSFGGPIEPRPKKGRGAYFGQTVSTAAVHDGLVYIPEENGYLHCLDAATGRRFWEYDVQVGIVGSPYWLDGRVFVPTEDGSLMIFAHGRTAKLLATIDMDGPIYTTPVAANGTLYIAATSKLYAISSR